MRPLHTLRLSELAPGSEAGRAGRGAADELSVPALAALLAVLVIVMFPRLVPPPAPVAGGVRGAGPVDVLRPGRAGADGAMADHLTDAPLHGAGSGRGGLARVRTETVQAGEGQRALGVFLTGSRPTAANNCVGVILLTQS